MLVVTTNRLECIDEAMGIPNGEGRSTRPGRIDEIVKFPTTLSQEGRRKIATRIIDGKEYIEKTVEDGYNDTPAQFQDRCITISRELFWQKHIGDLNA
jgi:SpoVK/Ycf46/Vps4 family AAA+-type ATPase